MAVQGRSRGSGYDLESWVNEAALEASRSGVDAIRAADFRSACDKTVLGDPRDDLLDPEERHRVVVHAARPSGLVRRGYGPETRTCHFKGKAESCCDPSRS